MVRAVARRPPERTALVREASEHAQEQAGGPVALERGVGAVPVEDHAHADSILEEEEGGEQSEGDQGPGDRGGAEEPAEGGGRPEGQEDHQEEPLDRVGRHCVGRVGAVLDVASVRLREAVARDGEEGHQEEGEVEGRTGEATHQVYGRSQHRDGSHENVQPQSDPECWRRWEAFDHSRGGLNRLSADSGPGQVIFALEYGTDARLGRKEARLRGLAHAHLRLELAMWMRAHSGRRCT
mmetsp:Transcript_16841/g.54852  ORF Transcript_16841/g.54852 Transcript_16841/m.54852 type:complete len:238 (+) Transcript_16841:1252-1965(+)